MPEKGWYSITVRKETAIKIRELAKAQGQTVDKLINNLMTQKPLKKSIWANCNVCHKKIKSENLANHMKKVHPKHKVN
jgi:hypothetical protein